MTTLGHVRHDEKKTTLSRAHRWRILFVTCGALCLTGCPGDDEPESERASKRDGKKQKSKKKKSKKNKNGSSPAASSTSAADTKVKNDDGSIPAPKPGEVPQFVVGAWSKYKIPTGEITWGLLEKRNTEYLIDAIMMGRMTLAIQAWVDVPDIGDARSSTIREVEFRLGGGAVQKLQGNALNGQAALYSNIMKGSMPPKWEGLPQEDVTVTAGTFRGCYKWISKETFMGTTTVSTMWSHPRVPPPAMVRSETKEGQRYELIAYGATGAKKNL